MAEKIALLESFRTEMDLYDGMIVAYVENPYYFECLKTDLLRSVYSRIYYYYYIMGYLDDPDGHPYEYREASSLKYKLRYDISEIFFKDMMNRINVLLGVDTTF